MKNDNKVRAKKHLGQHFLKDPRKAETIVSHLSPQGAYDNVLEIGPGMGILSDFLLARNDFRTFMIELDKESVAFLKNKYPLDFGRIIDGDFLQFNPEGVIPGSFAVIGNFPYNISSQILFRVLDWRDKIPELVGMFQKEVAERIAGSPGGREYGILSVFMQAFYEVKLVMTLDQNDFDPPPKVKSAVIHCRRKEGFELGCDEKKFRKLVKAAFGQRRKMLRNALAVMLDKEMIEQLPYMSLRAENLSWKQYVELTNLVP
ncbi:MAG: ribosomal RNA small subunit methyltransferase A [Bacteroidetes bacterium]|nr:MAG: ribosomal RNA small subunit methyltransferase A [Bacteroidota bacterium]REK04948.1 MAG: ribosomal RNA small subunit methyltransferase A [Bacteroidota bacterium]REK36548.1 MAG: ribosomal RNA small subunit methyltransferase A [Bacteroidota bacterium]REK50914.1 MAG: ribosomal RNA small subunit methyltransferase A [Bacteroidota bacterium]